MKQLLKFLMCTQVFIFSMSSYACVEAADKLANFLNQSGQFALIGEAVHRHPKPYLFLLDVLKKIDDENLDYIALEEPINAQYAIDQYLTGLSQDLSFTVYGQSFNEDMSTIKAFKSVLDEIIKRSERRKQIGLKPINVIALDVTNSDFNKFLEKDSKMTEKLVNSVNPTEKGILFLGAAHLTRKPIVFPVELGLGERKHLSLGANLENFLTANGLQDKIITSWIQPEFDEAVMGPMIPPSWQNLYMAHTKLPEGVCYLNTDSKEMSDIEVELDLKQSNMAFSKQYDLFISL